MTLLSLSNVARRLGVSQRTVAAWVRDGLLPAVPVGSRQKVSETALAEFLLKGAPREGSARPSVLRVSRRKAVKAGCFKEALDGALAAEGA